MVYTSARGGHSSHRAFCSTCRHRHTVPRLQASTAACSTQATAPTDRKVEQRANLTSTCLFQAQGNTNSMQAAISGRTKLSGTGYAHRGAVSRTGLTWYAHRVKQGGGRTAAAGIAYATVLAILDVKSIAVLSSAGARARRLPLGLQGHNLY